MKREEEIRQMANVYTKTIFGELDDFADITDAYIDGAKWADETMIEKACKWIENNKHLHKELSFGSLSTDWNKFIKEFKKAMEL